MNRNQFTDLAWDCRNVLREVADDVQALIDSPRTDEDYKIERDPRFSEGFFVELRRLADAVRAHAYKEGSPLR
jgi:hypothetical protein